MKKETVKKSTIKGIEYVKNKGLLPTNVLAIVEAYADGYESRAEENAVTDAVIPVTIHYDENGEAFGVRVRTLDEDFTIDLHDALDGRELSWNEAMTKFYLPTKKQASIICVYLDEINAALEKAGGDKLDIWYWTCSDYNANSAWLYNGSNGTLDYGSKYNTRSVRPVS